MQFETTFEVAGHPARTFALFQDLPSIARFVPGASLGERNPDGEWPATLLVSFGPKCVAFKGRLTHEPDTANLAGRVTGAASTDMRGAKMSVTLDYRLADAPTGTRVTLASDAELTGMLAEFARTGGVAVAEALIAEFASRFSAHVAAMEGTPADAAGPALAADTPALSAMALLGHILRSALRSLGLRAGR